MKKLTLRFKLIAGGILVALIPLCFVGYFSIVKASKAIHEIAEDRILMAAGNFASIVDTFIEEEIKLAQSIAISPVIVQTLAHYSPDMTENELKTLDDYLTAEFKKIGKGYETFFVTDANGGIISNSAHSQARQNPISVADRAYFQQAKSGNAAISQPVSSKTTGRPVAVVTVPVSTETKSFSGVFCLVVQLNALSDEITGTRVGKSGYPYILDNSSTVIAHPNNDLILKANVGKIEGMEVIAKKIAARQAGVESYRFRGTDKIAGFAPSASSGWSVVVTQDQAEFMAPIYMIRNMVIIAAAIFTVLTVVAVLGFVKTIMIQLGDDPATIARIADSIAQGDLSVEFDTGNRQATGVYKNMMTMTGNLVRMFTEILQGVQTLTSSSTELSAISRQMAAGSEQTSEKANTVSAAAEEMSTSMTSVAAATEQTATNLQMIVSAAEEMSATINEIAKNTATGSRTTSEAVQQADEISRKVSELGQAASEINKVTETISEISDQTNLLALNATIEAARAGESGKGFAVVAGEIKALAQQTAQATGEISSRIANVQASASETVAAIAAIVSIIDEINTVVTSVATAIEQQSATTQEISTNVSHAAAGVDLVNENITQASEAAGDVSQNIQSVSQSAGEIKTGSFQVNTSAEELSKLAEQLNAMMNQFKLS